MSTADKSRRSGIFLMALATLVIPLSDAIAKYLSETLSVGFISWSRFVFGSLLLLVFIYLKKIEIAKPNLKIFFLAITVSGTILSLFLGLSFLPLANNIALFFIEPLVVLLLAALFLKEKLTPLKVLSVILGLIGVIIVIRPNWSLYGYSSFFPLLAALFYGTYLTLTRSFLKGADRDPYELQLWIHLFATGIFSLLLLAGEFVANPIFFVSFVDVWAVVLLLIGALIALGVHILVLKAFKKADASVLAPLQYLEIPGAVVLGFIIFQDILDLYTFLGMGIIIASGLLVLKTKT